MLLSTVAVDTLKKKDPDSKISFVTSRYARPLLEGKRGVERIIVADTFTKKGMLLKAFRLSGELRKYRFNTAIILNPHKMLHLACFLAGIPERIGYSRKWGGLLTKTIQDRRDEGKKHEIEYTYDLLELAGVERKLQGPALSVTEDGKKAISYILEGKGVKTKEPFLVIHPGSSNPRKMWSEENYKNLIKKIRNELNIKVCILGDKNEKELIKRISDTADSGVISFSGELDLSLAGALLKKSILFIGNDAGPMHMAAAAGIPVVAIFKKAAPRTNTVRWRPWGDEHIIFHESGECEDAGHICMEQVTVDAVFDAVRGKLESG